MTRDHDPEERSSDDPWVEDGLEAGLAAAFSDRTSERITVLRLLQQRANARLGVELGAEGEPPPAEESGSVEVSARYQMLGEIGHGGIGTVHRGRDHDLGRDVAIKVLLDEHAASREVLARFVEEAQLGGQLQHPGIVPVYELGLKAGEKPYIAMKLVEGETLAAVLARRERPMADRRRLLGAFEQVCQTMAYAHARHVVHRDLKPANIMIGGFGEVQVVDWGLAKVLSRGGVADEAASADSARAPSVIETFRSREGSSSHSVAGSMLGTPAYMPPEQALGDVDRVDQRSDVFALGAILCEILTGEPPYRAGELVRLAATGALDDAFARLDACAADPALVALCKECLSPAQRARPRDAHDLAERIAAHLTSVEERAREAELRVAASTYKQRVTLLAGAAVLALLVLAAVTWSWLQRHDLDRRQQATRLVTAAKSRTSDALGQAERRADGLDVSQWSVAVAAAEQLLELAGHENVEPTVRAEAVELRDRVVELGRVARDEAARRARDARMLAALRELRTTMEEDVRAPGWSRREALRLDRAYGRAFAAYSGPPISDQPIERVLQSLRRGDIEVELAAALDHWTLVRHDLGAAEARRDAEETARMRELAMQLAPGDSRRSRLRGLLGAASTQAAALREIAAELDVGTWPAADCHVLAEALRRAGEATVAIAVLVRACEQRPADFDLRFQLALHHELNDQPNWEEVIASLRVANARLPGHDETLHRLGMALSRLRRHDEAGRVFGLLRRRAPDDLHWLFHLLDEHVWDGQRAAALDVLRSALDRQVGGVEDLVRIAHYCQHLGAAALAAEAARRALGKDRDHVGALVALGDALAAAGQPSDARVHFERAIATSSARLAIDPGDAEGLFDRGAALNALGDTRGAIADLRAAVAQDPDRVAAMERLGTIHLAVGDDGEAERWYRRAVLREPRAAAAHSGLGTLAFRAGDRRTARVEFEAAIAADPTLARAHASLGDVHRVEGRLEAARGSYARSIGLDASAPQPRAAMGSVLLDVADLDGALQALTAASALNPDDQDTRCGLGVLHLLRGDNDAALAEFGAAGGRSAPWNAPITVSWPGIAGRPFDWLEGFRDRIPALLTGEAESATTDEWAIAVFVGLGQGRYQEVADLTARTLERAPALVEPESLAMFGAIRAAVRVAVSQGANESTRRPWRELARTWFADEVHLWCRWVEDVAPWPDIARGRMRRSLVEPDFAGVRGAALDALPAAERRRWQAVWRRIEAALGG